MCTGSVERAGLLGREETSEREMWVARRKRCSAFGEGREWDELISSGDSGGGGDLCE
jgi:hypothetical protein